MNTIEITFEDTMYRKPQAEIDHLLGLGFPESLISYEGEREDLIHDALPMNPVIDEASHSFTDENGITMKRVYIRDQARNHTRNRLHELIERGVILKWATVDLNIYSVHALNRD